MGRSPAAAALLFALAIAACAPRQRDGMVVDPATGLRYGSTVERNLVVDASQFDDPRLKLRIRNTSGDPAFDLGGFRGALESAYRARGFAPAAGAATDDAYGVLLDVNVVYSGQVSDSLAAEYAFLGLAAGGLGGSAGGTGSAAAGAVSGATLGAILGSYVTDDTYIVLAEVTLAVPDARSGRTERVIQFGVDDDAEHSSEKSGRRRFDELLRTGIAVYAGGRNTAQAAIAEEVRQRFRRILADVI
jgi:hypothetical protein